MTRSSAVRLRLRALRRRGWILVLCMAAVATVAFLIASSRTQEYSATGVMVVPPSSSTVSPGSPEQAASLASTYRRVIEQDGAIQRFVARRADQPLRAVERGISVQRGSSGALVELSYTGETRREALRGARAVADAVTGPTPVTESIVPRAMSVVREPRSADSDIDGFTAQAVLLVSSGAGPTGTLSADQANKLAKTYAGLIPEDRSVLGALANRFQISPTQAQDNLSVLNDEETALVRVTYTDPDSAIARDGVRLVAQAVTGARPESSSVAPGSLSLVSLPEGAEANSSGAGASVPIGLFLGLCLGLVLLVALERADPRVDEPDELGEETACPASSYESLSSESILALLERWTSLAGRADVTVAFVPVNAGATRLAAGVQRRFLTAAEAEGWPVMAGFPDGADGRRRLTTALVATGPPGGEAAGEAAALGADVVVLVAPDGVRVRDVHGALSVLERFGVVPSWAIYVGRPKPLLRARLDDRSPGAATGGEAGELVRTR
jgi:capsular polysaccharide biosynthesis protein